MEAKKFKDRALKYSKNKIKWELLPKDSLEQVACVFTQRERKPTTLVVGVVTLLAFFLFSYYNNT